MSLFEDIERECDIDVFETTEREISQWMTYTHKRQLSRDDNDVFMFWKTNSMLHRLMRIAQRYMSSRPTSNPSRLALCSVGHVVTTQRAQQYDDSVKVLNELQAWKRFSSPQCDEKWKVSDQSINKMNSSWALLGIYREQLEPFFNAGESLLFHWASLYYFEV